MKRFVCAVDGERGARRLSADRTLAAWRNDRPRQRVDEARVKISDALVPPKPNELVIACSIAIGFA